MTLPHDLDLLRLAGEMIGDLETRIVGRDTLEDGREVSTVFLVLTHVGGMLYETAVETTEGGWDILDRYASRDEAVAGHDQHLAALRAAV